MGWAIAPCGGSKNFVMNMTKQIGSSNSEDGTPLDSSYCLETLSESVRYYQWIYGLMRPYLGARVVELGAGIGNLTTLLLSDKRAVVAIDTDERLIARHRQRVSEPKRLLTECVPLQQLAQRPSFHGQFDSVVSANVLEHVPDGEHGEILSSSFDVLRPGGYSVHWVPAFESIYGSLDRLFLHHRRYRKRQLCSLFQKAGFEIVSCEYWNLVGFFSWWVTGRVFSATKISPSMAEAFDRYVVPIASRLEPALWRPFGQSLLIVARRPYSQYTSRKMTVGS